MNAERRPKSLLGTTPDGPPPSGADADPSRVWRTCGSEYFTDADVRSCRDCGGTTVARD